MGSPQGDVVVDVAPRNSSHCYASDSVFTEQYSKIAILHINHAKTHHAISTTTSLSQSQLQSQSIQSVFVVAYNEPIVPYCLPSVENPCQTPCSHSFLSLYVRMLDNPPIYDGRLRPNTSHCLHTPTSPPVFQSPAVLYHP